LGGGLSRVERALSEALKDMADERGGVTMDELLMLFKDTQNTRRHWLHHQSFRRASLRSPSSKTGGAAKKIPVLLAPRQQFRRSLKTKGRKLADRRLKEIKVQIGCLSLADDAKLGFEAVANRWLESIKHTLASGTIEQREIRIKNLAPFFKGSLLRNVPPFQCERWAVERVAKPAAETFVHHYCPGIERGGRGNVECLWASRADAGV